MRDALARPPIITTEESLANFQEGLRRSEFERRKDRCPFDIRQGEHVRPEPIGSHELGSQRLLDKPSKLQDHPVIHQHATQQHRSFPFAASLPRFAGRQTSARRREPAPRAATDLNTWLEDQQLNAAIRTDLLLATHEAATTRSNTPEPTPKSGARLTQ
jgi:hypothetical protein